MVLRLKNFNILGVHWKIQLFWGGHKKTTIEGGGLPKKGRGLGQFVNLRGAWQERGGGVFEGGGTHYDYAWYDVSITMIGNQ